MYVGKSILYDGPPFFSKVLSAPLDGFESMDLKQLNLSDYEGLGRTLNATDVKAGFALFSCSAFGFYLQVFSKPAPHELITKMFPHCRVSNKVFSSWWIRKQDVL